jgi:hypothetical protein
VVRYGEGVGLHLSQIDEADELLTNDPLALLIGMVLAGAGHTDMCRKLGHRPPVVRARAIGAARR